MPRGRPKQPNSQDATLPQVRCTSAELQRVKEAANLNNMTISAYIRMQLFPVSSIPSTPPLLQHSPAPTPLSSTSHSNHLSIEQDSQSLPSKTKSSQIENPNTEKPSHTPSFVNETIARKTGHSLGCTCNVCARIRSVLSTNKPPTHATKRKR